MEELLQFIKIALKNIWNLGLSSYWVKGDIN